MAKDGEAEMIDQLTVQNLDLQVKVEEMMAENAELKQELLVLG